MNCDEKSLRELLASAFSLPAVESILRAAQSGEEIKVTLVSGEVVNLTSVRSASEFLVKAGCAPRLLQQVGRAIEAAPSLQESEMKRLRKRWEKERARHIVLMQEAFSVSHGLRAAQEKMNGVRSKKATGGAKPKPARSGSAAAEAPPKLRKQVGA
jgi:hypothetical protein